MLQKVLFAFVDALLTSPYILTRNLDKVPAPLLSSDLRIEVLLDLTKDCYLTGWAKYKCENPFFLNLKHINTSFFYILYIAFHLSQFYISYINEDLYLNNFLKYLG